MVVARVRSTEGLLYVRGRAFGRQYEKEAFASKVQPRGLFAVDCVRRSSMLCV